MAAVTTYPAGSPYKYTYPTDYYAYMGQETVSNEHTAFPPWPALVSSIYSLTGLRFI